MRDRRQVNDAHDGIASINSVQTKLATENDPSPSYQSVSIAQPNNEGTTTYLYQGNTVRVTSPSGKWKTYEMDAQGRMTLVTEPRPGGGTYSTSYAYNIAGKLISVSMPREGVTQTRTFVYDTATQSRLMSATNPENGTVTYAYNNDGRVQSKTDAKGVRAEFSYDAYARVTPTRRVAAATSVEDRCRRADYTYDESGGYNTGRLTHVKWNWTVDGSNQVVACAAAGGGAIPFEETYSCNAAGRVSTKTLGYSRTAGSPILSFKFMTGCDGEVGGDVRADQSSRLTPDYLRRKPFAVRDLL